MKRLIITVATLSILSACNSQKEFDEMTKQEQDKLIEERFRDKYPENYED